MTPCVSIKNVTKIFGAFTAVNSINLDIAEGEFFSLLGPSGCGKSTLLRMIAGFEMPTSGTISIAGNDMTEVEPNKRPTNMMFQSYALFPHLTVAKNIAFGLQQEKLPKAEIAARIAEVGEKLKLTEFMDRKPASLSGGQKQRVALARALVKRPKVLLLDEPLGALDKNLRTQTQMELMRLQKELGITFIIVTHDQDEAMTVSSRIAILEKGEIIQIGTPSEIYEMPLTRYVAKFLGETNIITADSAERDEDFILIESSEVGGTIKTAYSDRVVLSEKFWLSVRPERVEIAKSGTQGVEGLDATIETITYTGIKRNYRMRLATGKIIDAIRVNQGIEDDFEVGDKVIAHWQPDAARLLAD
ncbi:ABC transporter ATP-binding protein [Bartonella sp. HY329]|uniref:ABC transporter ATP-binding protein n=1 Tax=unclassified Bartonella TaxID=2645622 RepID=UPI0021C99AAF|nr:MULTISPECIES: ABC transporter ATP-binding protein [unclassified Bartonella]UXM95202.1 ABC transporter ATP-binding protein [Bartonella sp. HY329]UXN09525.1 ABC transporter ATP-binding protein [Bartonella sp. HY328]